MQRGVHIPVAALILLIITIVASTFVALMYLQGHSKVSSATEKTFEDIVNEISQSKLKVALVYSKLSQETAYKTEISGARRRNVYADAIHFLRQIYEGYGFDVTPIAIDDKKTTPDLLATYDFIIVFVPVYTESDVQKLIQYFDKYHGKAIVYFPSFYITGENVIPSSTMYEYFGVQPGGNIFDPRATITVGPSDLYVFRFDSIVFETVDPIAKYVPQIKITKAFMGVMTESGALAYAYADITLPARSRYIPLRLPLITYKSAQYKIIYVNYSPVAALKAPTDEVTKVHQAIIALVYEYFLS